ncbi:helix-turn-helix domain-containing protein, partial [Tenuibacillus multivorans]
MAKYSKEFKMKIVKEYLEGPLGSTSLAKKYGVPNQEQVRRWVNAYKVLGEEGLMRKRSKTVYPVQFKLNVLNFMKQTGASYQDTATAFKMNQPTLIT